MAMAQREQARLICEMFLRQLGEDEGEASRPSWELCVFGCAMYVLLAWRSDGEQGVEVDGAAAAAL